MARQPEAARGGSGVNIFAYVRGQFGLAESARLYTRALLHGGFPVALYDIPLDLAHNMDDPSLDDFIGPDTPHPVNLVFVNPDYLDAARAAIGPEKLGGRYTIGCWFWELENFPTEWLPALAHVDEIMVSSEFVRDLVRRVTDKPILHVPLPVLENPDSGLLRSDFGLRDDDYVFLTSFDFNSFMDRKNPMAVIRAFHLAFGEGSDRVRLLIKTSNGHRHPGRLRELLDVASSDPRILVRDEVIEREHVQALQRCADAYVSLHRAEGFGLGLAECMRSGKPVIATGWSGNMEFMTPENSFLVSCDLVPVGPGEYLYAEGQRWADPDVAQAAHYMRQLADDPALGRRVGERASRDIRENLAASLIAQRLASRLAEIHQSGLAAGHSASC
ncbi:MAG TPA: glycosyltransferase family 4 protein [Frateuria sp.]|nr:glycosyltransferase family 4 protein [Frateuria sp.]HET6805045.1 glycosyltransferase family 4 protein [Frateuria sp.]